MAILAIIAGVEDINQLAEYQFRAKSSELAGLSAAQLCKGDCKVCAGGRHGRRAAHRVGKRHYAARKVQSWARGVAAAGQVRRILKSKFGIDALECECEAGCSMLAGETLPRLAELARKAGE